MRIVNVTPLAAFHLRLSFDNGESGTVDLSALRGRGVFAAWDEPGLFEKVAVTSFGAVEWPGELDLCPDALYLQMSGKKPEDIFPSLKNRLSHA